MWNNPSLLAGVYVPCQEFDLMSVLVSCSFPVWNQERKSPITLDHCHQSLSEIPIPPYTDSTSIYYTFSLRLSFFQQNILSRNI